MKNKISMSYENELGKEIAMHLLKKNKIKPIEVTDNKVYFMATRRQEGAMILGLMVESAIKNQ